MALQIGSLASNPAIPPGWFNVKDYGAVGDFVHDDTTAIQAAVTALKASKNSSSLSSGGQVLYFPQGTYKVSTKLDMTGLADMRVLGAGGPGPNYPAVTGADPAEPTVIYFTGGGSGIAVDMGDSVNVVWDGVSINPALSTFTGTVLNWDATASHNITGNTLQNCRLGNSTGAGGLLLSLDGHIGFTANHVTFDSMGTSIGTQVRGINPAGHAGWFNANAFRDCLFKGDRQYSMVNPGTQVLFTGCWFEVGSVSGPAAVACLNGGLSGNNVVSFVNCGFWDVTSTGGVWVKSTVATTAWSFFGCYFEMSTDGPLFSFSAMSGLAVHGCRFQTSGAATPNIYDPAHTITNGSQLGCYVLSPVVDNHASVFV